MIPQWLCLQVKWQVAYKHTQLAVMLQKKNQGNNEMEESIAQGLLLWWPEHYHRQQKHI